MFKSSLFNPRHKSSRYCLRCRLQLTAVITDFSKVNVHPSLSTVFSIRVEHIAETVVVDSIHVTCARVLYSSLQVDVDGHYCGAGCYFVTEKYLRLENSWLYYLFRVFFWSYKLFVMVGKWFIVQCYKNRIWDCNCLTEEIVIKTGL